MTDNEHKALSNEIHIAIGMLHAALIGAIALVYGLLTSRSEAALIGAIALPSAVASIVWFRTCVMQQATLTVAIWVWRRQAFFITVFCVVGGGVLLTLGIMHGDAHNVAVAIASGMIVVFEAVLYKIGGGR